MTNTELLDLLREAREMLGNYLDNNAGLIIIVLMVCGTISPPWEDK